MTQVPCGAGEPNSTASLDWMVLTYGTGQKDMPFDAASPSRSCQTVSRVDLELHELSTTIDPGHENEANGADGNAFRITSHEPRRDGQVDLE